MSDLRNLGSSSEPMTMSEKIPETNLGAPAQFQDTGGLSNFHHPVEEETNSNTARIIGAAAVAVLLCGAGAYAYMSSSASPPAVGSSLPATSAPQSVAANTPAPAMQTAPSAPPSGNDNALANSPYGSAPVTKTSPAATPASAPEDTTVIKHHIRTARADHAGKKEAVEDTQEAQTTNQLNAQESTTVTQQNTAANTAPASTPETATATPDDNVASSTPLPTPPAAPPASVASNGQPAASAPQNLSPVPSETPAQPAPTTPAPDTSNQQPNQAQPAQVQPQ